VHTWAGFQTRHGEQVVGGIGNDIVNKLVELNGSTGHIPKSIPESVTLVDPEVFKYVAQKMCIESGVRVLLHSFFVESYAPDGTISSITVYNKSGRQDIHARFYIDCTGDGDVAAKSGCIYEVGRRSDGKCQPLSMTCRVAGFDRKRFVDYMRDHPEEMAKADTWTRGLDIGSIDGSNEVFTSFKGLNQLVARIEHEYAYVFPRERVNFALTPIEGIVYINSTRVTGVDATDAEGLTTAELSGREQVMDIVKFLTRFVPGFESAYLLDTSIQIGVRETRRIIGDYVIERDDVLDGTRFDDVIAQGIYPLDIHDVDGRGMEHRNVSRPYQVPYRSLIPKGLENIFVGGRCVSSTHEALGALRVIPNCMAMGQAAGTAAALAYRQHTTSVRNVNVVDLQGVLRDQGAIF